MSVPKSFEQVLRGWRGRATNSDCEHCQVLIACAAEAQPILDKLRGEVESMPHDWDDEGMLRRTIKPLGGWIHIKNCERCRLQRLLGEPE